MCVHVCICVDIALDIIASFGYIYKQLQVISIIMLFKTVLPVRN